MRRRSSALGTQQERGQTSTMSTWTRGTDNLPRQPSVSARLSRDSSAGGAWPILTENNHSAAHVTVGEYFTHRLPERHEGPGRLNIRTLRSLRYHVVIYAGFTLFLDLPPVLVFCLP